MARELRARMFPSRRLSAGAAGRQPCAILETLVHAFLPGRFIDHTHADAVLALTNQPDGDRLVRDALGDDVIVLPYVAPGFLLARAAIEAARARTRRPRHGLVAPRHRHLGRDGAGFVRDDDRTGDQGRAVPGRRSRPGFSRAPAPTPMAVAASRVGLVAPLLRGLLAPRTGDPDRPYRRVIVQPLVTDEIAAVRRRGWRTRPGVDASPDVRPPDSDQGVAGVRRDA